MILCFSRAPKYSGNTKKTRRSFKYKDEGVGRGGGGVIDGKGKIPDWKMDWKTINFAHSLNEQYTDNKSVFNDDVIIIDW